MVVFHICHVSIRRATLPLKQLSVSADEVAKGNFHTQLPVIEHDDEIKLLRDSFDTMQHSLSQYVKQLTTTTAQKAAIESELHVARSIQMSMLPKTFPPFPERSDIDIFGQLTPAKAVGGDLFDFYLNDNQLFFCVGDVSGKGVPASLVMAVARSLFRNISAHIAEPHRIVTSLNEALADGNETNMFVTLFVGVLNLENGCLSYCNAGHNEPILISDSVQFMACDPNLPVGIETHWDFTLQETQLAPGTTLFIYTDGLNEAENAVQEQFGDNRMLAKAGELLAESLTAKQIVNEMTDAVHRFVGDAEPSDDMTMLAIQYKGK
jgi:sigma-B regulation protein RsbU (phosphoserine phosphatase)